MYQVLPDMLSTSMTLLHILHARLDLDDGTELVHHYYQGNPAAEKINGVLQLAFLPKQ